MSDPEAQCRRSSAAIGGPGGSWPSGYASIPCAPPRPRASATHVVDVGGRSQGGADHQAPALRLRLPGEPEQRPPAVLQRPRLSPPYSIFRAAGAISEEELVTYRRFGSLLESHPTPCCPGSRRPRLPAPRPADGGSGSGPAAGRRLGRRPRAPRALDRPPALLAADEGDEVLNGRAGRPVLGAQHVPVSCWGRRAHAYRLEQTELELELGGEA
jgi:hypothetical protein